jgi:hypothetical protein
MSHRKKTDAKNFEAILTPENKTLIEKTLDAIETDSCFHAAKVMGTLGLFIGESPMLFLANLLQSTDSQGFLENAGLSEETQKYLHLLHVKYGYKVGELLFSGLIRRPDEWISMTNVSANLDIVSNELCLRLCILKANKEQIILEDTFDSYLRMINIIFGYMCETPNLADFAKATGITKESIKQTKTQIENLEKILFRNAKDDKKSNPKP